MKNLQIIDDEKKFSQESFKDFQNGEVIFREGDDSREMYIVTKGEVIISKKSARGDVTLATLRRGDFLGEMSLLESLPRSATAVSQGDSRLLAIHPGGFLLKIRRDPTFAFEMLQSLSRRIRFTNDQLMDELNKEKFSSDSMRNILSGSEFIPGEGKK